MVYQRMRKKVKSVFKRRDMHHMLSLLESFPFVDAAAGLSVHIRKSVAFQLGQTLGLVMGRELFTKGDIAAQYPRLHPWIARTDAGSRKESRLNVQVGCGCVATCLKADMPCPAGEGQ